MIPRKVKDFFFYLKNETNSCLEFESDFRQLRDMKNFALTTVCVIKTYRTC